MSKSKEELNAIKEEVETVNEKLHELTEEDLEQVTGGVDPALNRWQRGNEDLDDDGMKPGIL